MTEVRGIDTDPLIRFVTGDVPEKQERVRLLLERVKAGELRLLGPVTVIADAAYVLASPRLYNMQRSYVADMLTAIMSIPGFEIQEHRIVLRALQIFAATRLDFGDAMLIASLEAGGRATLYSYDRDYDRVHGVTRLEP